MKTVEEMAWELTEVARRSFAAKDAPPLGCKIPVVLDRKLTATDLLEALLVRSPELRWEIERTPGDLAYALAKPPPRRRDTRPHM